MIIIKKDKLLWKIIDCGEYMVMNMVATKEPDSTYTTALIYWFNWIVLHKWLL